MSRKQYDTYNFEFYPESSDTPIRLSFDINADEGLHCAQLHRMYKAFAYALGYSPNSIEKYFGEDSNDWLD